jgi:hypothetical protein
VGGAKILDFAMVAVRFSGVAPFSSVGDEEMGGAEIWIKDVSILVWTALPFGVSLLELFNDSQV